MTTHVSRWILMDTWFEQQAPWLHRAITAIAAALGFASFKWDVNTILAVFSILWLATQLWRFWRYERPRMAHERDLALRELERAERMAASSTSPE